MDNIGTIIAGLLAAAFVGFIIYRVLVGSSGSKGSGTSIPRRPGGRPDINEY